MMLGVFAITAAQDNAVVITLAVPEAFATEVLGKDDLLVGCGIQGNRFKTE
jgi:hypothetical protein